MESSTMGTNQLLADQLINQICCTIINQLLAALECSAKPIQDLHELATGVVLSELAEMFEDIVMIQAPLVMVDFKPGRRPLPRPPNITDIDYVERWLQTEGITLATTKRSIKELFEEMKRSEQELLEFFHRHHQTGPISDRDDGALRQLMKSQQQAIYGRSIAYIAALCYAIVTVFLKHDRIFRRLVPGYQFQINDNELWNIMFYTKWKLTEEELLLKDFELMQLKDRCDILEMQLSEMVLNHKPLPPQPLKAPRMANFAQSATAKRIESESNEKIIGSKTTTNAKKDNDLHFDESAKLPSHANKVPVEDRNYGTQQQKHHQQQQQHRHDRSTTSVTTSGGGETAVVSNNNSNDCNNSDAVTELSTAANVAKTIDLDFTRTQLESALRFGNENRPQLNDYQLWRSEVIELSRAGWPILAKQTDNKTNRQTTRNAMADNRMVIASSETNEHQPKYQPVPGYYQHLNSEPINMENNMKTVKNEDHFLGDTKAINHPDDEDENDVPRGTGINIATCANYHGNNDGAVGIINNSTTAMEAGNQFSRQPHFPDDEQERNRILIARLVAELAYERSKAKRLGLFRNINSEYL